MPKINVLTAALLGVALTNGAAALADPVGTAFSYQGELKKDGDLVNDDCDFKFSLFDGPDLGDAQIGATLPFNNVTVTDGQVNLKLDFGGSALLGEARWLEIEVDCPAGGGEFVKLDPRQELTPAPYAIGLSLPFQATIAEPGSVLTATNIGGGRAGNFEIANAASTAEALRAYTNSSTGKGGLFFNDAGGTALHALATFTGKAIHADGGGGTGVYGESSTGTPIHGVQTSGATSVPGVLGETSSGDDDAVGVRGNANVGAAGGFRSAGVRGYNSAIGPKGAGVYGEHATEGSGVYGTAPDHLGKGVFGESANGTGVLGITHSAVNNSYGVSGIATEPVSSRGVATYGVYGESNAVSGIGVYGTHLSDMGTTAGVHGETQSIEEGAVAVLGRASAPTPPLTTTYGVYGESTSTVGIGVYGTGKIGVQGEASQGFGRGVEGKAWAAGDVGVYAYSGPGAGYALRADRSDGTAFFATGFWAIHAQATSSYGILAESDDYHAVMGRTDSAAHYGGYFVNDGGGIALRAAGTASVNVLEIQGADLAERFPVSEAAEPGMVVAIDPQQPGKLCVSREPYNKRVAGVISGANDLDAGVVLGNLPGSEEHLPVALTGRVWVLCDASQRAVEPGDFLSTAKRPGYAMPVLDESRAHGAILGKAMTALAKGETGLVLVLVNLQ